MWPEMGAAASRPNYRKFASWEIRPAKGGRVAGLPSRRLEAASGTRRLVLESAKRIGSRARSVKGCRTAPTENGTGHGDRVVAEHLIRTGRLFVLKEVRRISRTSPLLTPHSPSANSAPISKGRQSRGYCYAGGP
jgi:hypothetical protein